MPPSSYSAWSWHSLTASLTTTSNALVVNPALLFLLFAAFSSLISSTRAQLPPVPMVEVELYKLIESIEN
jgi:hypothetical protein